MIKQFIADMHVPTIYDIDLTELRKLGKRGIITDLDNTLVGAKEALATPELIAWLSRVQDAGFQVVVVSNNNQTRVSAFAEPLGIPFVHSARKPRNRAFVQALKQLNLRPEETVMLGDQMMTDVFGGNRMGLYTILVRPIAPLDEGFFTRVNRRMERIVIRRLEKQGYPSPGSQANGKERKQ